MIVAIIQINIFDPSCNAYAMISLTPCFNSNIDNHQIQGVFALSAMALVFQDSRRRPAAFFSFLPLGSLFVVRSSSTTIAAAALLAGLRARG